MMGMTLTFEKLVTEGTHHISGASWHFGLLGFIITAKHGQRRDLNWVRTIDEMMDAVIRYENL